MFSSEKLRGITRPNLRNTHFVENHLNVGFQNVVFPLSCICMEAPRSSIYLLQPSCHRPGWSKPKSCPLQPSETFQKWRQPTLWIPTVTRSIFKVPQVPSHSVPALLHPSVRALFPPDTAPAQGDAQNNLSDGYGESSRSTQSNVGKTIRNLPFENDL